ncbi:MAG: porin [Myxococcota bacterium]
MRFATRTCRFLATLLLLSSSVPAVAGESVTSGYSKGFFMRSTDDAHALKLQGRLQARYVFESIESGIDESAFSIPRARLTFSGHAYAPTLNYQLQIDFGKGSFALKDFYADYQLIKGLLHVRAGQYKKPFSRQQINSSGRLEIMERAITDKYFGAGRDIGLALHNNYEKSPTLEYAVGIFNGTGDEAHFAGDVVVDVESHEGTVEGGKFTNVPQRFHPMLVARIGYNHGGIKGYREADLEGGPLRFAVAVGVAADFNADGDRDSGVVGELDAMVKMHGMSASGGIYVSSAQARRRFKSQAYEAFGFHLQAGYVMADRFQPVIRYARIMPDASADNRQELLTGVTVYFFGHSVKWQLDGGALITETPEGRNTDTLVRTQVQLAF